MAYPASDRSPISPSFVSNPFDKYKNARAGLPSGIGGIGTGSDRFSSRRKPGERRRLIRIFAAATLVGLLLWFWLGPPQWPSSSSVGTVGNVENNRKSGDIETSPLEPVG